MTMPVRSAGAPVEARTFAREAAPPAIAVAFDAFPTSLLTRNSLAGHPK